MQNNWKGISQENKKKLKKWWAGSGKWRKSFHSFFELFEHHTEFFENLLHKVKKKKIIVKILIIYSFK